MDLNPIIQNGGFGMAAPMQQQYAGFNPYMYQQPQQMMPMGNMVPFGNYQQQPIQNPVYSPVNPMQFQQSPFGGDYNNPYAGTFAPMPQYNYCGGYSTPSGYGGAYVPGMYESPLVKQQRIEQQKGLARLKYEIAAAFNGRKINYDKLNEQLECQYNPNHQIEMMSSEERESAAEWNKCMAIHNEAHFPTAEHPWMSIARMMREMSYNYHKELDSHSLCQFLEDDLWKLQREFWIAENIDRGQKRNLSAMYDSKEYNELLNLHKSANPYVGMLLDDSRYDNINDNPLGMNVVFNKEQRRLEITRGPVPSFISSDETQQRRHAWTQEILNSIYGKGGMPVTNQTGGDS